MRIFKRKVLNICLLVCLVGLTDLVYAQVVSPRDAIRNGSLGQASVSSPTGQGNMADSSAVVAQGNFSDSATAKASSHDTLSARRGMADAKSLIPLSADAITSVVHYQSADSISFDINRRKARLYSQGAIEYGSMELRADDVRIDFDEQMLLARPVLDSAGKVCGRPFFKEGGTEYMADSIAFNYVTKKGIISGVITKQGEGFLHGSRVKKVSDSVMYLDGGQYTTCNYSHPHFAINFGRSKLITGDKIFTGPAYVTIEDVPTPLMIPFAFFPMKQEVTSGILMPSYGWMDNRGYYLKDGGYYWAINDFIDLSLRGELYTNLSWAAEAKSNYYVRYKYKGNFDIRYGITKEGIPGDSATYSKYSDFKVSWRHDQDAKANPRSRFSANVNLQSRNYNKNTTNSNDYFNSTTTSSVSYSASLGSLFSLSASLNESYNAQTGVMNIKLPSVSLSSTTIYPLRRKAVSGDLRWYENLSLSYSLSAENNISSQDSDLFKLATLSKMQYGIQHAVPLSLSLKVLRFFNWTNTASYYERWHWSTISKTWDESLSSVVVDTVRGFRSNRDVSFASTLSTRIYGMFNFKYGPVKAVRHVINPSVSFNFRPDFGDERLGWWRSYTDNTGYVTRYSIFEHSLYGGPPDGRSGAVRFNVGNNLEMKVKDGRDTVTGTKKVTLLENLNLSASYDLAKDSLRWSDFLIAGRTTLFKNLVLNYSGSFSPYYIDSAGRKHDKFVWEMPEHRRLLQRNNSTVSAQFAWNLNNDTFKPGGGRSGSTPQGEQIVAPIMQTPYNYNPALLMGSYADFSMPWNLSVSYTFSYVSTFVAAQYNFKNNVIQTLGLSGNIQLTPNWRVSVSTGYDFVNKGMSYTSIDIFRDLHCWEMRFNWVPFGFYKSWNFQINIKANSLKDVKYTKQKAYQSNRGYYSY